VKRLEVTQAKNVADVPEDRTSAPNFSSQSSMLATIVTDRCTHKTLKSPRQAALDSVWRADRAKAQRKWNEVEAVVHSFDCVQALMAVPSGARLRSYRCDIPRQAVQAAVGAAAR
jgi:hypothetical protein